MKRRAGNNNCSGWILLQISALSSRACVGFAFSSKAQRVTNIAFAFRLEQERKRQEELERQLERQREIEREREEQRRKAIEQKEAAQREMERQRQMEWERYRLMSHFEDYDRHSECVAFGRRTARVAPHISTTQSRTNFVNLLLGPLASIAFRD